MYLCYIYSSSYCTEECFEYTRRIKLTHLACFVQRDADGQERDDEDTGGIIIVVIGHPQGDAEHLKDIKGIEDLKRKEKEIEKKVIRKAENHKS